jgi:hypothetical protein
MTIRNNLKHVEESTINESVAAGEQRYRAWCAEQSFDPHMSVTHTFDDTRAQAEVLALLGTNMVEQATLAELTFLYHLADDMLDPTENNVGLFGDFGGDYSTFLSRSPPNLFAVLERISAASPSNVEGSHRTAVGMLYGELIQDADSAELQERYCREFQNVATAHLPERLRDDLRSIHPAIFALERSTIMDAWFAVPGGEGWETAAGLLNAWAAPLLYMHNSLEEASEEGAQLGTLYGAELVGNDGRFEDNYLTHLVHTFTRNAEDLFSQELVRFMKAAHSAFKPVLSDGLKGLYCDSFMVVNEG